MNSYNTTPSLGHHAQAQGPWKNPCLQEKHLVNFFLSSQALECRKMLQSFRDEGEPRNLGFLCRRWGEKLGGEACSTVPIWIREGQGSASREAGQPGGRASMQNTQLSPGEGGQAQQHATESTEASACCWDAAIYVFFLSSFSQNTPCLCLCQPLALGTPYHSHSILGSPVLANAHHCVSDGSQGSIPCH